jgi:hypothetical protein
LFSILAILKQLAGTGHALSIVGMSFCILHDYVVESRGILRFRTGALCVVMISFAQVIDLGLPNGLLHGAHKYYGIAGYVRTHRLANRTDGRLHSYWV